MSGMNLEDSNKSECTIKEGLEKIFKDYASLRNKSEKWARGNDFYDTLTNRTRKCITTLDFITGLYVDMKFTGGNASAWRYVPYIRIYDKKIARTAKEGVYIIYLVSKDTDSVYLTLNQGCKSIQDECAEITNTDEEKAIEVKKRLRNVAKNIINAIDKRLFESDSNVYLGDNLNENERYYQDGTIFYKKYNKNDSLDEKVLRNDLRDMVEIYQEYIKCKDRIDQKLENNKDQTSTNEHPSHLFNHNRIIYGAPGTGKSFLLNKEKDILLGEDCHEFYERVTFHPDYSYANFVGTYKPIAKLDADGNEIISYKYVPGPFMRIYVKAKNDPNHRYLLIIEEINRAMVAAVFGDIFQLLDRKSDGSSEYPIQVSEDIRQYLKENLQNNCNVNNLSLPSNLFIWATMNSADQGVFPLDTAFKRRWDFTYIGIDDNEALMSDFTVTLGKEKYALNLKWNDLRKQINNWLCGPGNINEDKLLGPHFISSNSILIPGVEIGKTITTDNIDNDRFIEVFKNKVIMYLFEDAAKQKRASLFTKIPNEPLIYSELCKRFDDIGIKIFNQTITDNISTTKPAE